MTTIEDAKRLHEIAKRMLAETRAMIDEFDGVEFGDLVCDFIGHMDSVAIHLDMCVDYLGYEIEDAERGEADD